MDGKQFGEEVVQLVKSFVKRELDPLRARIAELERQVGKAKGKRK